jgi:hypothetical protein
MTRRIALGEVQAPPLEFPDEAPSVRAEEFEARITALLEAVDADRVVVYGDREHAANLIYLCNLDPRFEEALLVLGGGRRTLLVGKEDVGYTPVVPIDLDVVCCPTLSLMGIDRRGGPTVERALREAGIDGGQRVAVIGWKALLETEWTGQPPAIFAPAFFVDALRRIVGDPQLVTDATRVLTSPRTGLRTFATADLIAVFEWGASRCSAWVQAILRAARPGATERDSFRDVPWAGEPLTYHPVFASGPDVAVGLRSPTSRRLGLGDAAIAAVGLWGGNCARGGLVVRDASELTAASDGYLERLAIPYWRAIAGWYEALAVGVTGGDVLAGITSLLAGEAFEPSLNPGHLVHYEEWMDSPFRADSPDVVASGMVLQCDLIPTGIRPGWTINCEDTVAIADDALREQLSGRHPALWSRIRARRNHMRDQLGIELGEDVLPLSCTCAYLRPFWLAPEVALTFT